MNAELNKKQIQETLFHRTNFYWFDFAGFSRIETMFFLQKENYSSIKKSYFTFFLTIFDC